MNILVTGRYEPGYNRNRVLLNGLRAKGVNLTESPYDRKKEWDPAGFLQKTDHFDLVFLPAFTHYDVRFIKKRTGLPLVFDPLISRYLSKVFDYKKVQPYSPRALKNFLKDKRSMEAADVVLADTHAHRDYYMKKIGINPEKIVVVPVGVDTREYQPVPGKPDHRQITVGFYGSFIPLHGIAKIVETAVLLKNQRHIRFELIGDGVGFDRVRAHIRSSDPGNITLTGRVPPEELPERIGGFDLCLGIFGDSLKARLVIPNKIYHYCAMGKPVITMDSPAIREVFTPGTDLFTTTNTPHGMATMIMERIGDASGTERAADAGMRLIRKHYNEKAIADYFLRAAQIALSGSR